MMLTAQRPSEDKKQRMLFVQSPETEDPADLSAPNDKRSSFVTPDLGQ
jgi:hypothetical protein